MGPIDLGSQGPIDGLWEVKGIWFEGLALAWLFDLIPSLFLD